MLRNDEKNPINGVINKNNTDLDALLSNIFKYKPFNNHEVIDFNRIKISGYSNINILNCLFSQFARSVKNIDTMLGIELSEKRVFMLSNGEKNTPKASLADIADIYEKEQIIVPKERLSCDFFVFTGGTLVEEISTGSLYNFYNFADELKDLNIKLYNSKEYYLETELYSFYEVLCTLNKINNKISSIDFLVSYNGKIQISYSSLEYSNFCFIVEANNIVHLNYILKDIDLNDFINFLIDNQLSLIYKDNEIECKELSNKANVFYFDSLKVRIIDDTFKYFIKNINASKIDTERYIPLRPFLSNFIELLETSSDDIKLKIFKSIFIKDKHQNLQYQEITDQEIADMHHTTKNNIVETYRKRKVEQYEILRLGTTCKKMGITEDELLGFIASCGLERCDKKVM